MLVSCILVSHQKPEWCMEAVESVLAQKYALWQCLVVDSGLLFDAGYFSRYANEPRFTFIRSTETEELRRTKAMAPRCFNECFRRGVVEGELVVYLCDDDLYYDNAFQTFVDYAAANPEVEAMYASQDVAAIHADGRREITGQRRAQALGGKCCKGRLMDCQVDYAQIAHRRSVLDKIRGNDRREWWPESRLTEGHADGVFMERIGSVTPFYPIDVKVSQNRRTPKSLYCPLKS